MIIHNEFNKVQINATVDKAPNGRVLKKSLMINIRCNDTQEAAQLYRQLTAELKLNGDYNNAPQKVNPQK